MNRIQIEWRYLCSWESASLFYCFFFFLLISVEFKFCYSQSKVLQNYTLLHYSWTTCVISSVYLWVCMSMHLCGCLYAQWNNNLIHRVVPSVVTDFSCYPLFCFAKNWEFQGSYCFNEPMFGGTCTLFCKWNRDQGVTQPVLWPGLMPSLLSLHQEIVQGPQVNSRNPTPVQMQKRESFPGGSPF